MCGNFSLHCLQMSRCGQTESLKLVRRHFGNRTITPYVLKICLFSPAFDLITEIKWYNFLFVCFAFLNSPSKKRLASPTQFYTVVARTELFAFKSRGIISLYSEDYYPLSLLCLWIACLGGYWSQGNFV
jgi:hypothetical protein